MNFTEDYFLLYRDFYNLMMGKKVGNGIGRQVFIMNFLPDCVAKIEMPGSHSYQNLTEWRTWTAVRGTRFEKWFAPCRGMSPDASVLIMARTREASTYPKQIPAFLCDTKRENYGMYKSRFVCHDYGTNLLMINGLSDKLRKVEWWDESG